MVYHPNISLNPMERVLATTTDALASSAQQKTSVAGSASWRNEDGSRTLVGPAAGEEGIVQWVGDKTAPGRPSGIAVDSAAGMVLVSWDGSLEGGMPADFGHLSLIVDGREAGKTLTKGTYTLGPFEAGSKHEVKAVAWDDAHAQDGSPAPNGSRPWGPVTVTVKGDAGAEAVAAAQAKAQAALDEAAKAARTADGKNRIIASAERPSAEGLAPGDLWFHLGGDSHVSSIRVWDGGTWSDYVLMAQKVLVPGSVGNVSLADGSVDAVKVTASEALLEKLLVRKIRADEISVGSLSAAIVQSGMFSTPDGLTGFDPDGFWVKDTAGGYSFRAGKDGVQLVGKLSTAPDDRARFELYQESETGPAQEKRSSGVLNFFPAEDPKTPVAGISGWDTGTVATLTFGPPGIKGEGANPRNVGSITASGVHGADGDHSEVRAVAENVTLIGVQTRPGQAATVASLTLNADESTSRAGHVGLHASECVDLDAPSVSVRGTRLPLLGWARAGSVRSGSALVSLSDVHTQAGDLEFAAAQEGDVSGVRVPVSGWYSVSASVQLLSPTPLYASVSVYPESGGSWVDREPSMYIELNDATSTWASRALPNTSQHFNAGDIVTLRTSGNPTYFGPACMMTLALMPY